MGSAMVGSTVRWFGPSWGAPICQPQFRVPNPADGECVACGKGFEPSHQGIRLPYFAEPGHIGFSHFHLGCFLVSLGIIDEGRQYDTNAGITVFVHTDLHRGRGPDTPAEVNSDSMASDSALRPHNPSDNGAVCTPDANSDVTFDDTGYESWLTEIAQTCKACLTCSGIPCAGCQQGAMCDGRDQCRCDLDKSYDNDEPDTD